MAELTDRFWAKVDLEGPVIKPALGNCWTWTGALSHGYGHINVGGIIVEAHRVAYELVVGKIPAGLHIDHLCVNRRCVNPAHLEPVTQAENSRRHFASLLFCRKGHPYSDENVYRFKGRRYCRACRRLVDQRRQRRN